MGRGGFKLCLKIVTLLHWEVESMSPHLSGFCNHVNQQNISEVMSVIYSGKVLKGHAPSAWVAGNLPLEASDAMQLSNCPDPFYAVRMFQSAQAERPDWEPPRLCGDREMLASRQSPGPSLTTASTPCWPSSTPNLPARGPEPPCTSSALSRFMICMR